MGFWVCGLLLSTRRGSTALVGLGLLLVDNRQDSTGLVTGPIRCQISEDYKSESVHCNRHEVVRSNGGKVPLNACCELSHAL